MGRGVPASVALLHGLVEPKRFPVTMRDKSKKMTNLMAVPGLPSAWAPRQRKKEMLPVFSLWAGDVILLHQNL